MTRPYSPVPGIVCRGLISPSQRSGIWNAAGTVENAQLRIGIYLGG